MMPEGAGPSPGNCNTPVMMRLRRAHPGSTPVQGTGDGVRSIAVRRLTQKKMVLPDRIELSTSPLPMECSTTELRQHARYSKESAQKGAAGGRFLPQGPLWRKHEAGHGWAQNGQKSLQKRCRVRRIPGSRPENASKQKAGAPVLIQSEPNRLQTGGQVLHNGPSRANPVPFPGPADPHTPCGTNRWPVKAIARPAGETQYAPSIEAPGRRM
jgi:hypothetical protein